MHKIIANMFVWKSCALLIVFIHRTKNKSPRLEMASEFPSWDRSSTRRFDFRFLFLKTLLWIPSEAVRKKSCEEGLVQGVVVVSQCWEPDSSLIDEVMVEGSSSSASFCSPAHSLVRSIQTRTRHSLLRPHICCLCHFFLMFLLFGW